MPPSLTVVDPVQAQDVIPLWGDTGQWAAAAWMPDTDGSEPTRHDSGAFQAGTPAPQPGPAAPNVVPPRLWAPGRSGPPVGAGDLVRKDRHGDNFLRRVGRGARQVVGGTAAEEARMSVGLERIFNRPVSTCRQIAVTSIRGGAGKTTVVALIASVIARYRQDRVLALDADSELGSLPLRVGVEPRQSLHDLAEAQLFSWQDAAGYLTQTSDGLLVLSGTAGGKIRTELKLERYQAITGQLSRYFAATVVDCGAGLLAELQRGILAEAHAQVLITQGTADGALSARGALDWLAANGHQQLLPRTVIVMVTHTPHVDADLDRAAQMLSAGGITVVHLPYDRHLAAGIPVQMDRLAGASRAASVRIAVEAFNRAMSV